MSVDEMTRDEQDLQQIHDDARSFMCTLLGYVDTRGEDPMLDQVYSWYTYFKAKDKGATLTWLKLKMYVTEGERGGRRTLHPTDLGREWLALPAPQPPIVHDPPRPLPDDEIEYAWVWMLHLYFHKHGRWPLGNARARNHQMTKGTKEERAAVLERLLDSGRLVRFKIRKAAGHPQIVIADPEISPEFRGANGMTFYAADY